MDRHGFRTRMRPGGRSKLLRCLCLVLTVIALCWGVGSASAQQKTPSKQPVPDKPGQPYTITDAAGRTHLRHAPITDKHRKAVAKRMNAARLKAAKKGK